MGKRQIILILGVLFIGIIIMQQRMTGQAANIATSILIKKPQITQFQQNQCNQLKILNPGRQQWVTEAQIGSPQASPGRLAEYYIVYYELSTNEPFKVYGAGPNGIFGDADDTGDRPAHRVFGSGLVPMGNYISAFGDSIAYMLQPYISGQQPTSLVIRRAGNDGMVGLGGDDPVYIAATPPLPTSFTLFSEGNRFDLLANSVAYGVVGPSFPVVGYVYNQNFGPNTVPEMIGTPGLDDIFEVTNSNNPYTGNLGFIQATLSKVTGRVDQLANELVTYLDAPGPNGMYEPRSSPTFDDQSLVFGGGNVDYLGSQMSYDGNYMMSIVRYPSRCHPTQPSNCNIFAELNPIGTVGAMQGQLNGYPTPVRVPLPTQPNSVPNILAVDVDGPYTNAQGQRIAGALAVAYQPVFNQTTYVYYQNTGPNGNFDFSPGSDDMTRLTALPQVLIANNNMQIKEDMMALPLAASGVGFASGVGIIKFC